MSTNKYLEERFKGEEDFKLLETKAQSINNEKFKLEEDNALLISRNIDLEK